MRTQIFAVMTAATVVVTGLTTAAAGEPAHHPPRAHITAAAGRGGGPVTVTGPHMYDPATGKPFPQVSTVTVSQAAQLVNQMVQVSWTGFTPSTALAYNPENVYYPVMVAECRGTGPASPADCYGATNGGVTSASGPYGPDNTAYATTGPNGTGKADIDILAKAENYFLGCDQAHPCSLAIVPAQGGDVFTSPPKCGDHGDDTGFSGTASGQIDFGANYYGCSWAKRIVVPLSFARTPASCPHRNAAFSAAGSPMLARAMDSWEAALCAGSHGLTINYDPGVSEPLSLEELASGEADVALTTRTAGAQGINTGPKHYVYAPVAASAVSVAYWFDSPVTGLPQTGVKLDQRLVLKLVTQSYAFLNDGCPQHPKSPLGCDKGVDHDKLSLFADPEFTRLNPAIAEPVNGPIEIPTVVSGQSDTTWTVTRWIGASRAASQFLAGQFDPYGEHVNTYYLGDQYPTNTFVNQDPYPIIAHEYSPVFPFSQVATDQVENWPPGTFYIKDQSGNYDRLPAQIPGQRALIAITGQGDAAADLFPVAALRNGAGDYTEPTGAGMAAAVRTMIPAGDGTLQVNQHSANPAVYPLTMIIYAVAPTSGTSHAKAAAIAKFIDYAAGAGQAPGVHAGQLPPGFLPLPAALRAQARKDAQEVRDQTGNTTR
jgi:hypothetical protein